MLTLLSGLYSWAGKGGEVSRGFNPTADVTPFRETGRERFLSVEEMTRLGDTLRLAETVGLPWCVDEDGKNAKHVPKKASPHRDQPYRHGRDSIAAFHRPSPP